MGICQPE